MLYRQSQLTTKSFDQAFSGTPVVLTTVASYNDANAVAPRTQNVGSASFQLKLQEEDLSSHGNETIQYIAITKGLSAMEAANFKAGITSNSYA
ncbi:MAG: H-type lectin domain-containing protein [Saprospiraceae bacterium]